MRTGLGDGGRVGDFLFGSLIYPTSLKSVRHIVSAQTNAAVFDFLVLFIFYWKGRLAETWRDRKIFHLLVLSPNGHNK